MARASAAVLARFIAVQDAMSREILAADTQPPPKPEAVKKE